MNILDLFRLIADKENKTRINLNSCIALMLEDFKINNNSPLEVEGCYCNNEPRGEVKDILMSDIKELGIYLYDLTGHTGEWFIREVDSIKDAEEYILSPGGYLNMFTTTLLVINKGKVKDFKVYEILENGKKQYVEDDQDCKIREKVIIEWI
ncbi:MAG: hypothetical protein RSG51_03655 [Bacilli bacterium]